MPTGFWDSTIKNLFRIILATETDAGSGIPDVTYSQLRKWLEFLTLLNFGTGVWGTVTGISGDTLTDSARSWGTDEHNGRTLAILSGGAISNLYTIDDTTGTTLVCTGDDLEADGVEVGDEYAILYDVLNRNQGHTHDDVNTPYVVLADAQVTQAKLKTSTGSVSHQSSTAGNYTLPGGQYGFYPLIYMQSTNIRSWRFEFVDGGATFAGWTSARANVLLAAWTGDNIYGWQRYVTSSGEVHWIFILRDKTTKEIIGIWEAPDHPCMGNGGNPDLLPHPFLSYDQSQHDIIVISFDPDDVILEDIKKISRGNRCLADVILNEYDLDESIEPPWPNKEVTVGLPDNWDTAWLERKFVKPIKKKIPKPQIVKTAMLMRKQL